MLLRYVSLQVGENADMSDVVEIYSARGDESIREGALDYSSTIVTKGQAEADAVDRCKRDRTIRKVAYYLVRDDGSFRTLLSYENPEPVSLISARARRQMADPLPRMKGKAPAPAAKGKPKLMDRLIAALKE
jgi:hypothetical protein